METNVNPLLKTDVNPAADVFSLEAPTVHRRPLKTAKRDIRDVRRAETAATALAGFDAECEIYGFTKGQFSVIDVLTALLAVTGPAELVISTWTAANADVTTVLQFVEAGTVTGARWLVDLTFQRRTPQLANRIRQVFGPDAIRVAKNHAKFALLSNDRWKVVLRTSMNLNFNPRFENFQVAHDPELFDFHAAIIEELWTKQPRTLADANPGAIGRYFAAEM